MPDHRRAVLAEPIDPPPASHGDGRYAPWGGGRLAAYLADFGGDLPQSVWHAVVLCGETSIGTASDLYWFGGDVVLRGQEEFRRWIMDHGLAGPAQLAIALLLIRPLREFDRGPGACIMEYRRGALDGPLAGHPARVRIVGSPPQIRLFDTESASLSSSLTADGSGATSCFARPVADNADEMIAISAAFGGPAEVIARRIPTTLEAAAGFSDILRVHAGSGIHACGLGWHGPVPFVLPAGFTGWPEDPALTPAEDAAVAAVLRCRGRCGYEVLRQEEGLSSKVCNPAADLVQVPASLTGLGLQAYHPIADKLCSPDQQRWMQYVTRHEHCVVLDARPGANRDLLALAAAPDGHVWRFWIDQDGVELARIRAD